MSPKSLAVYGLTWDDRQEIVLRQRGLCPICALPMVEDQMVVDHQHHPKWRKMKPEQRRALVRGITHRRCNWRFLGNLVTVDIACRVADYLLDYKDRCSST